MDGCAVSEKWHLNNSLCIIFNDTYSTFNACWGASPHTSTTVCVWKQKLHDLPIKFLFIHISCVLRLVLMQTLATLHPSTHRNLEDGLHRLTLKAQGQGIKGHASGFWEDQRQQWFILVLSYCPSSVCQVGSCPSHRADLLLPSIQNHPRLSHHHSFEVNHCMCKYAFDLGWGI